MPSVNIYSNWTEPTPEFYINFCLLLKGENTDTPKLSLEDIKEKTFVVSPKGEALKPTFLEQSDLEVVEEETEELITSKPLVVENIGSKKFKISIFFILIVIVILGAFGFLAYIQLKK